MVVNVAAVRMRMCMLVGLAILVGMLMRMSIFGRCFVFRKHLTS